ncbi:unnamed protein product [Meloidogyne enterolobii]|uniref:Uncharacterized protein n=1 Tax=Meloidogyne enterolobii TaxID=390850 RepID=A0ACB0ZAJ6_MELEN
MGINFLSEKANWMLEIVSHKNKIKEGKVTEKYEKFGNYDDKNMFKTFELLDRYARFI